MPREPPLTNTTRAPAGAPGRPPSPPPPDRRPPRRTACQTLAARGQGAARLCFPDCCRCRSRGVPHMSKPTILTVDDDPLVSAAIARDLTAHYGTDYRVVRATSGPEALSVLARLALRDDPVALIAADQRMPRMTGI